MNLLKAIVLFTFLVQFSSAALAQQVPLALSSKEMSATIDSICEKLQKNYVNPEVADEMANFLKTNFKNNHYISMVEPSSFAQRLTKDLQTISKDKHLSVIYNPSVIAREQALTEKDRARLEVEENDELLKGLRRDNFGFREVKILDGNIGYIDLREFADPKYSGGTLTAAMSFLGNTEAIILDLRKNDGGSPAMVQLVASYFFSTPTHLFDFYNRPKKELTQSWTLPYVSGISRPTVDLYILTSSKTFSAAESLTYCMKNLKRATIIGETTAGGAHLTGAVIATDNFFVRIPQGRPVSPITNTNWEGVGIVPDIQADAGEALKVAHAKALEKLKK
jgi:retinol-binding protein 3